MSLLDDLTNSGIFSANNAISSTIGEARSSVNIGLTNMVSKALPKLNQIPGVQRAKQIVNGVIVSNLNSITASSNPLRRVGDGVRQVFDASGVPYDSPIARTAERVYNNGISAAKQLWDDVESGDFKVGDIVDRAQEPMSLLRYTHDNALEATPDTVAPPQARYSPYAMDLFRLAPKHKFLFVVEFVFNGGYDFIGQGPEHKNQFALVISDFERPKIKYEYEDNVNYYNFRTKIVKKVIHDPLTIKFLDDRQNLSMKFVHEYLKATHPLTAVQPGSAQFYEDNGMNFEDPLNSSSTQYLKDSNVTILNEIKVYHLYDFGAKMNVYHFMKPKMLSLEMDHWSMHESDASNIITQFGYDGMFIELAVPIGSTENTNIQALSDAGQYQLHPRQTASRENTEPTIPRQAQGDSTSDDQSLAEERRLGLGSASSSADQSLAETRRLGSTSISADQSSAETNRLASVPDKYKNQAFVDSQVANSGNYTMPDEVDTEESGT